jgi:hypothetical protein
MKKQLVNLGCLLLGIVLGVGGCLLVSFLSGGSLSRRSAPEPVSVISSDTKNDELAKLAIAVAERIAAGDYEGLSEYVHPVFGLVLAPGPTLNLGSNQCFTPQRVAIVGRDSAVYIWGVKYGSDEPIQMTTSAYFSRYVYDRDYARAPVMGFNTVLRTGNALENVASAFPDGQFVDLYFPPSSAEAGDWRILRMVFEDCEGEMKLSALIHSEYTD